MVRSSAASPVRARRSLRWKATARNTLVTASLHGGRGDRWAARPPRHRIGTRVATPPARGVLRQGPHQRTNGAREDRPATAPTRDAPPPQHIASPGGAIELPIPSTFFTPPTEPP